MITLSTHLARLNEAGDFATAAAEAEAKLSGVTEAGERQAAMQEQIAALAALGQFEAAIATLSAVSDAGELRRLAFRAIVRLGALSLPNQSEEFSRRVLIDLAEKCVGRFEGRRPDSGQRISVDVLNDLIAAARRGEAPQDVHHLVFPRAKGRRPIGRRRDVITVIPNVALAGIGTPYGLGGYTPVSLDGYWVGAARQGGFPSEMDERLRFVQLQCTTLEEAASEKVADAVFVAAGGGQNNFGHTIRECLPSLQWYRTLGLDCPILLPQIRVDIAPRLREALDLVLRALEIPSSRLLDPRNLSEKHFALGILPNQGDVSAETVAFFRNIVLPLVTPAGMPKARTRLYLSRRDSPEHPIVNEDEIIARLAPLGFVAIEAGFLPFEEQVRHFAEAEIVVGAQGSGLNHMFFAPPEATLIEILTIKPEVDRFAKLTMAAGQNYHAVEATRVRSDQMVFHFDRFDALLAACEAACAASARSRSALSPSSQDSPSIASGPMGHNMTIENLIAFLGSGDINSAQRAAAQLVERGASPAKLLFEVTARLEREQKTESARLLFRWMHRKYANRVRSHFIGRLSTDAARVGLGDVPQVTRQAERGVPPKEPLQIILPRSAERVSVGRSFDTILLMPRVAFAGIGTPYFLGGHTPMSLDGYWMNRYIQGGAAGGAQGRLDFLHWQASLLERETIEECPGVVFVAAGGGQNNYGHALLNCLPSLHWYKALNLSCPIVLPKLRLDIAPRLGEAVELVCRALGIDPARIVPAENLRGKSFALGILPNAGDISPETVAFYRSQILGSPVVGGQLKAEGPPRIYVARRLAVARRMENEHEIIRTAEALGFTAVDLETIPFIEQIGLFRSASIIAGTHGSGFANIMFAGSGTHVIEIRTIDRDDFERLAAAAGQRYTLLPATAIANGRYRFDAFDRYDVAIGPSL